MICFFFFFRMVLFLLGCGCKLSGRMSRVLGCPHKSPWAPVLEVPSRTEVPEGSDEILVRCKVGKGLAQLWCEARGPSHVCTKLIQPIGSKIWMEVQRGSLRLLLRNRESLQVTSPRLSEVMHCFHNGDVLLVVLATDDRTSLLFKQAQNEAGWQSVGRGPFWAVFRGMAGGRGVPQKYQWYRRGTQACSRGCEFHILDLGDRGPT